MVRIESFKSSVLAAIWLYAPWVLSYTELFPRDGPVSGTTGYPGMAYQAVRYEPLCGNLGTDERFSHSFDLSGRCAPAIDAFGNNTADTLAIYDTTGTRLKGAIVGNGYDTCLCFALGQSSGSLKGGVCIWVSGGGEADVFWNLGLDHVLASAYRPNIDKALPLCKDIDLQAAKVSWSATAIAAQASETARTIGGVVTTTYIPEVVNYTQTMTLTTTDSGGSLTTQTLTRTTELPVVTTTAEPDGLTRADKIALGVGLGIGIPTIILMILALCLRRG